jgi:hypothetical protein
MTIEEIWNDTSDEGGRQHGPVSVVAGGVWQVPAGLPCPSKEPLKDVGRKADRDRSTKESW